MTLAQLQSLLDALSNAGAYGSYSESPAGSGNWVVHATKPSGPITSAQLTTFANNISAVPQPVVAYVVEADFR